MNDMLRNYKARVAFVDIVMLALGIGFLIWQDKMMATLIAVAGILIAVCGAVFILNFITSQVKTAFDWGVMVMGVVLLAGGIIVAVFSGSIVDIAVYLFATLLIIYGLIDAITALTVTRQAAGYWWISMLFGLATLIFGIIIFVLKYRGTDTLAVLIGISFIAAALGGIINAVQTAVGRRKIMKMMDKATKAAPPPPPAGGASEGSTADAVDE